MYVGVDVGGTKTLVCLLDDRGKITHSVKLATPRTYDHFLLELRHLAHHLPRQEFRAGGAGIPATVLDREHGRGVSFGNLPWRNVPVQHDLEQIFKCPFVVENDAKLAGLAEAVQLKPEFERVLYVTVSTGIGFALVVDGAIDPNVGDGGGRALLLEHRGKLVPWESFASGRAIVERYGRKASEIDDSQTWQKIVRDLAPGLIQLIAVTEPEVIVMGGGVGAHFTHFGKQLASELRRYHLPLVPLPAVRGARHAEEAVIYGCYEIAKQTYGHAVSHR